MSSSTSSTSSFDLQSLKDDLDTFWLMFGAILVFFMQCGFAMLEVGSVSKKNTKNILIKNIGDAAIGAICWWLLGFGFAFGETSGGFIGTDEFALKGDSFKSEDGTLTNGKQYAFWFFQYAFCAVASTIVSGTVSERTSLNAYVIYTVVLTSFVYPVVVHWGWAGGWTSSFIENRLFGCGLLDFAGSGVVHMTGGIAALCGSYVVGPRIGRFNQDGSVNNLPQQSPVYQTLGTLILWMGWYGFNGVSTLAIVGASSVAAKTMVTTTISAASAGLASVVISRFDKSFWDFGSAMNGVLAGLVGITAGCSTVEPEGAFVIGIISSLVYIYSSKMLLKFGIDDVVDAIPIHMFCGIWGVVASGLFATKDNYAVVYYGEPDKCSGLFYGGNGSTLLANVVFILAVLAWVGTTCMALFVGINKIFGMRVDEESEKMGMDASKHGVMDTIRVGPTVPTAPVGPADTFFTNV